MLGGGLRSAAGHGLVLLGAVESVRQSGKPAVQQYFPVALCRQYCGGGRALYARRVCRSVLAYLGYRADEALCITKGFAPDIRPLLLVLFSLLALVVVLGRRMLQGRAAQARKPMDIDLLLFMAVGYVLWILTSGNGRYALPVFLLCGLMLRCLYLSFQRQ